MRSMRGLEIAVLCVCLGAVAGCSVTGPAKVKGGRRLYNVAVQETNKEQMLLNIVRLRFLDAPFFLQVASVSTNFTFESSAVAGGGASPSFAIFGLAGRVASSPTVTYTPLQGEQFAQRLLAPVDLSTILLLTNTGWSIQRVFRLCVQSIEGLPNAPTASGPTPADPPVYERFLRVTELLRSLQKQGELTIGYEGDPEEGTYVLEIASEALDWPETRELTELLGLEPNRGRYRIVPGAGHSEPNTIGIAPRSLTGSFFYVSHGVEVPQEDLAAGRVTVTRKPDGEEFDWSRFGRGLLAIRSSEDRPDDAAVAVLYHDTWFYIADNDIDSKATFSLLMQLFALSAGETPSTAPILTLPVGVGSVR
jgi:hypothetical protein